MKFFKSFSDIAPERRRQLKTLKLGNLGLLDSQLLKITSFLEKFDNIEKVSLHSNKTLATGTGSGVRRFLKQIGRNCRVSAAFRHLKEPV
jgi:Leucine-rich repeat (LRR) protein